MIVYNQNKSFIDAPEYKGRIKGDDQDFKVIINQEIVFASPDLAKCNKLLSKVIDILSNPDSKDYVDIDFLVNFLGLGS